MVPFRMLPSNHMVVEAKLNGTDKTYRLIFDLGSPVTLLSNRAAEASGAVPKGAPRSFLFGARGEGKLDSLQLGDLKAETLPVVVMDHPALKALSGLFAPIDGIVGYTFFARYKTTIDYQSSKMTFVPAGVEVKDFMKEMPQRMMGSKAAKTFILAPAGLWGMTVGDPVGGVSSRGVPITAIADGSPAAMGGLKVGDILMTLDGRWATSIADVYSAAADVPPGQGVEVVVLREEKEVTVTVTPRDGI